MTDDEISDYLRINGYPEHLGSDWGNQVDLYRGGWQFLPRRRAWRRRAGPAHRREGRFRPGEIDR